MNMHTVLREFEMKKLIRESQCKQGLTVAKLILSNCNEINIVLTSWGARVKRTSNTEINGSKYKVTAGIRFISPCATAKEIANTGLCVQQWAGNVYKHSGSFHRQWYKGWCIIKTRGLLRLYNLLSWAYTVLRGFYLLWQFREAHVRKNPLVKMRKMF